MLDIDSEERNNSVFIQKLKYNQQAKDYYLTHGDLFSQKYREEFIRKEAFPFVLNGKKVLDAMCAFGAETGYLIKKGASVEGLDISEENAKLYENIWKLNCHVESINRTSFPDNYFDVVYICGGLHHVLPLLDEVIKEIHRILKPKGFFCFVEPNAATWLNYFRKKWYKMDKRFSETEEAICYVSRLKPYLQLGFKEKSVSYGGGVAYLLFAQSLILKTPLWVKKGFYKPFTYLEKTMRLLGLCPRLFFVGVWQKGSLKD
ncbi:MAG: class I SAM-dependent methyltransferase [Alphaproteobacteria bacterium]|nr:class I SAM-dependent methyltransferase [Alphaproteobacteria bacterium]